MMKDKTEDGRREREVTTRGKMEEEEGGNDKIEEGRWKREDRRSLR